MPASKERSRRSICPTEIESSAALPANEASKRYFDPKDGQVAVRIESFIKDGGELARTMEKFLSPEHGALARTLAKELGENSPLLRRLSPTDNEGIVHVLEGRIRQALEQNQLAVTKALDPLAQDGAVARFLRTLRKDMEKADNDRTKQLTLVTKALDANDESSLFSRLMRETQSARVTFVRAMNPDEPGSPLAVLKTSLTTLLDKQAKSQTEAMVAIEERQQKLDQYIRDSVARLEERRRGDARSARGGTNFEDIALRSSSGLCKAPPSSLTAPSAPSALVPDARSEIRCFASATRASTPAQPSLSK